VKRSTNHRLALMLALAAAPLWSQPLPGARGRGGPPKSPKAGGALDLTGYWVSVVTEDWRYRMVTPPKGKFGGVPLNAEGRKLTDQWDPAKDEAEGQQCKSYGAPALMRVPGRLHITWEDETTLRIDADAGKQTRLFHFGGMPPKNAEPSWQGYSTASWEYASTAAGQARTGDLKVITTALRPGYLRKNGVPYSGNAALTEYYDVIHAPNGDQWLVVTTIVTDPEYLRMPFITSTHFKKLPDASGWDPEPCSAR
ncbi:MAG TPA: hypothetical protein VJ732_19685, partial [Bryobacteraceae bacterium]|nr:hypothetical protein [Bryobacteraceae bacterium]